MTMCVCMCEEGECCGFLSPCCCFSAAVVNPVWETQNTEWCLNGLSQCVGAGHFERTWPKQGHRDQLSAFKSVWPLAKPNEAARKKTKVDIFSRQKAGAQMERDAQITVFDS